MKPEHTQNSPETNRPVLTAREAAQLLSVSEKTIYRLCDRRLLKRIAGIRHLRISRKSIESFYNNTID